MTTGKQRRVGRRHLLTGAAVVAATLPLGAARPAAATTATAQQIADHFSSVKSMAGEFVQFGPRGEQTSGRFFINRPGKLRFNYEDPSPVRVISDGKAVAVGNSKLKTWDLYPLSSTPLKLLLSERIDVNSGIVKSVREDPDLITIVLGDRTLFGNATITMMFDPSTYELRQWTITDVQGKDTTVMIYNVQTGVSFAGNTFAIPYDQIRAKSPRQ